MNRVIKWAAPLVLLLTAFEAPLVGLCPVQDQADQEKLTEQVRKRLARLSSYGAFDWLGFEVNGSTVILSGYASRPSVKFDAERSVSKVKGVEIVENRIEVLPTSGSDDRIRMRAYTTIYGHSMLQKYLPGGGVSPSSRRELANAGYWGIDAAQSTRGPHAIHIIVRNGNVLLLGMVSTSQEKQVAGIQANSLSGVFSVDNQIQVRNL